jgi:hypothetical protein
MRGTGYLNPVGLLKIKHETSGKTDRDLYSKNKHVCWHCQKGKTRQSVNITIPFGVGGLRKIICHDCAAAAKEKKESV